MNTTAQTFPTTLELVRELARIRDSRQDFNAQERQLAATADDRAAVEEFLLVENWTPSARKPAPAAQLQLLVQTDPGQLF